MTRADSPTEGATGGAPVRSATPELDPLPSLQAELASGEPAQLLGLVQRLLRRVEVLERDRPQKSDGRRQEAALERLAAENAQLKRAQRAPRPADRSLQRSPLRQSPQRERRPDDPKILELLRTACKEHELENARLRQKLLSANQKLATQSQQLQKQRRETQRLTHEHVKLTAQIVDLRQRLGEVSPDVQSTASTHGELNETCLTYEADDMSPEKSKMVLSRIKQELCDVECSDTRDRRDAAALQELAPTPSSPQHQSDGGSATTRRGSSATVDPPTPSSLVQGQGPQDWEQPAVKAADTSEWLTEMPPPPVWDAPAPWLEELRLPGPIEPLARAKLDTTVPESPPEEVQARLAWPRAVAQRSLSPSQKLAEEARARRAWDDDPPLLVIHPGSIEDGELEEHSSVAGPNVSEAISRQPRRAPGIPPPDPAMPEVEPARVGPPRLARQPRVRAAFRPPGGTAEVRKGADLVRRAVSPPRASGGVAQRVAPAIAREYSPTHVASPHAGFRSPHIATSPRMRFRNSMSPRPM